MTVLYVVACGSPAARGAGRLIAQAQEQGWTVCVVTTPDGRRFIDAPALAEQTGFPVRSVYKNPGDPDLLPPADAMIVAPATVNTTVKWSLGIADTLALGMIVEALGKGLPLVCVPFTNSAMANHPGFGEAVARLRSWGVDVLWGDGDLPEFPPGAGDSFVDLLPWSRAFPLIRKRLFPEGPPSN